MTNKKNSPDEPGFLVSSPCGRRWFVPITAIADDYAEFLIQVDKVSVEEARTKTVGYADFLATWFAEQLNSWEDVDRLGRLVQRSTLFKTKAALDRRRTGSRVQDYEEIGMASASILARLDEHWRMSAASKPAEKTRSAKV